MSPFEAVPDDPRIFEEGGGGWSRDFAGKSDLWTGSRPHISQKMLDCFVEIGLVDGSFPV